MAGGFCIGGIDTYAKRVCRRRRDRGERTNARSALVGVAETGVVCFLPRFLSVKSARNAKNF